MLYPGYREKWHDHQEYQFESYECYDDDVFYFEPEDSSLKLENIPTDTVPVNSNVAALGWRVCHHQPIKNTTTTTAPIIGVVQFVKS